MMNFWKLFYIKKVFNEILQKHPRESIFYEIVNKQEMKILSTSYPLRTVYHPGRADSAELAPEKNLPSSHVKK